MQQVVKRGGTVALSIALIASATSCGSNNADSSTTTSMTKVTIGKLPEGASGGFLDMAQKKGFYKKHGIDLKVIQLTDGSKLTPALVSGSVDMVEETPSALIIATQKQVMSGKIIGSTMPGLPWAIYGGKDVTSLKDLEGKTMAVSTTTGLPAVVANLILKKNGVDPTKIKYVNQGANADRYKAVANGVVASASIPSDFVPQAKKDGLNVLALASEQLPQYPRYAFVARDEFLAKAPDAAAQFLAASMEGAQYAYDHPDEAKALAAEVLGGSTKPTDPIVVDMYDQIVRDRLVDPNGEFPLEKLDYLQQTMIEVGLIKQPVPREKVYDDKYRQAALKLLGK